MGPLEPAVDVLPEPQAQPETLVRPRPVPARANGRWSGRKQFSLLIVRGDGSRVVRFNIPRPAALAAVAGIAVAVTTFFTIVGDWVQLRKLTVEARTFKEEMAEQQQTIDALGLAGVGDEAPGRIAPDCELSRIKTVQCRIGAKKAHGGLAVLNCGTGKIDKTVTRTAKEAVIETDDRITFAGQRGDIWDLDLIRPVWPFWFGCRAEIASGHGVLVTDTETAAVNPNH